ncbi:twin-arginine translocation signal domain-containing protein, partial [Aquibium carbonis]
MRVKTRPWHGSCVAAGIDEEDVPMLDRRRFMAGLAGAGAAVAGAGSARGQVLPGFETASLRGTLETASLRG